MFHSQEIHQDEARHGRGAMGPMFRGRGAGPRSTPYARHQNMTLLVDKIPPELCNIDQLNAHFKQFGRIVNVNVQQNLRKAFVQFGSHAEALKAFQSPDAVLGNRFITVFWARPEGSEVSNFPPLMAPPHMAPGPPHLLPHPSAHFSPMRPIFDFRPSAKEFNPIRPPPARGMIPSGPLHPTKADSLKSLVDIQRRKKALLDEQISHQKLLIEKLESNKNMPDKDKKDILDRLEVINQMVLSLNAPSSLVSSGSPSDPHQIERDSNTALPAKTQDSAIVSANSKIESPSFSHGARTGFPAHGRGAASLGSRGRGRGGFPNLQAMQLDNRPKKVLVENLPRELEGNTAALASLFMRFGEIGSISPTEKGALVEFKFRKSAEMVSFDIFLSRVFLMYENRPSPVLIPSRRLL